MLGAIFLLFFVGILSIYLGLSGSLGHRRLTYILPNYYSSGINYASIPGGVFLLLLGVVILFPLPNLLEYILVWLSVIFGLIGLLFNFFPPSFLEPEWYRWLKKEHGDILPSLQQDVEKMGYRQWRSQTETIADLDRWATEVRRKNGLPEKPTPAE
jgi:hypothetical protein